MYSVCTHSVLFMCKSICLLQEVSLLIRASRLMPDVVQIFVGQHQQECIQGCSGFSEYLTKIVSKHLPAFMDGILILVGFKSYGQLSNCQEMRKSVEFCHLFSTSTTMNMNRILSQCTCVSKTTNLSYLANTVSTRWVSNQNSLKQHIIHSKNERL